MNSGQSLIVIGNGPSLSGVPIERFVGIDTIGMNAAYRAWERKGWWPTYYACADHRLALSHIPFFRDAAATGRFKRMLLPASVLDEAPELARNPDVEFLDQYLAYWYGRYGEAAGLRRLQSEFFESTEPSLVTTGAVSVRWGASLGYSRIGLIGIDCRYVELPAWQPQADSALSLRMAETPEINPNYFFPDYQREGDLFNVPEPSEHGNNLHLAAIAAVRDDLRIQHAAIRLTNLSEGSELLRQGTLRFQPVDEFLGASGIGTVILDHRIPRDIDVIKTQLRSLADVNLLPSASAAAGRKPVLVILVPDKTSEEDINCVRGLFREDFYLNQQFAQLKPVRLDMEISYNSLVTTVAEGRTGFALIVDAKARPLRFGWLDSLQELCQLHGGACALGGTNPGVAPLLNLAKVAQNVRGVETDLIVNIERHSAETLEEVRVAFPAAVFALNAVWIDPPLATEPPAGWHRSHDRIQISAPAEDPTQVDPWLFLPDGPTRTLIGLRGVANNFAQFDELEIEVSYTAIGGYLAIAIQSDGAGQDTPMFERFEARGIGRSLFRASLSSSVTFLWLSIELVAPAHPEDPISIIRLDQIHVRHKQGDAVIGQARLVRLRRPEDFGDLKAVGISRHKGERREFLDDGRSSFRHDLVISMEGHDAVDCAARSEADDLILATVGRMTVVRRGVEQAPSNSLSRIIWDYINNYEISQ